MKDLKDLGHLDWKELSERKTREREREREYV